MESKLKRAYDPKTFRTMGHELVDLLADHLTRMLNTPDTPVLPRMEPAELLEKYRMELSHDEPFNAPRFFEDFLSCSIHLHNPGYVGHQVGAPAPLGALAGLIAEFLNNGSAIFEMGPANSAMEKVVLEVTAQALGFPASADGVFTSGGSLGNLTALLAALKIQLVKKEGADPIRPAFLVPETSHYSVAKALRIMGFSSHSIVEVPTDPDDRIDILALPGILDQTADRGLTPVGLVANACSTATGSYDDLRQLSDFSRENELWLHIDGAHGVAPIFSSRYRSLLDGIEHADSVVIDFHKMLMAPALTTAVIFRNGTHSYRTFAEKASYLWHRGEEQTWYDFSKRTMECTKLSMGVKVYSVLKAYGTGIFAEQVDTLYDLARSFATEVKRRKDFELALDPESNIVCFRVVKEGTDPDTLDRINSRIREKVIRIGDFYIVQARLRKGLFLRTALMNPFTTVAQLRRLLDQVEELVTEVS